MASLRTLMKSKTLSSRLTHPYARYSHSNALSCSLCGTPIKGGDQLWGAHLQSKGHRVAVAKKEKEREREEERRRREVVESVDVDANEGRKGGKRRLEEVDGDVDVSMDEEVVVNGREAKKARVEGDLPSDFFDAPPQNPQEKATGKGSAALPPPQNANAEEEDPEWAAFEASVLGPSSSSLNLNLNRSHTFNPTTTNTNDANNVNNSGSAIVYSSTSTISGNAVMYGDSSHAEGGGMEGIVEGEEEEEEPIESEEQRAERMAREEREEMVERMLEEEREQLEGDKRVERVKKLVELRRKERLGKKKKAP
ncbi:hypothetical protein BT69DRAFT_1283321 [Atractiella rhizophila]|nr:hypothetical protein BT69DRAFT_1283321 [Atractiella rhizophila]